MQYKNAFDNFPTKLVNSKDVKLYPKLANFGVKFFCFSDLA